MKLIISWFTIEAMFDRTEPIFKNDTIYVDLSNIRLKKVNRTHQQLIDTFEFFQPIGNDYEVIQIIISWLRIYQKKLEMNSGGLHIS